MSIPIPVSPGLREAFTSALSDLRRRTVRVEDPWEKLARPSQREPEGRWRVWVLCTGRGWGKNRVQSQWAHRKARELKRSVGFVAGRTLGDIARNVINHPRSGLLATQMADNPCRFKQEKGGGYVVVWANGSRAEIHTSEEPDRARGPEYEWGIADEIATWKRVVDFAGNTTWQNLRIGTRGGASPRIVAGTTPRRGSKLVRELLSQAAESDRVRVTRGATEENRANLPDDYYEDIVATYAGTSLERQELRGEILPDVEGAYISLDNDIVPYRESAPLIRRVVVGLDPSGGKAKQGIVVGGVDERGHLYALADRTCLKKPGGWARRAIEAVTEFGADCIAVEVNFGGDMAEFPIQMAARDLGVPCPRVRKVTASRGKHIRFGEILSGPYEQGKVHHVDGEDFSELEDQIVQFTPDGYEGDESPNNADAWVFAARELLFGATKRAGTW